MRTSCDRKHVAQNQRFLAWLRSGHPHRSKLVGLDGRLLCAEVVEVITRRVAVWMVVQGIVVSRVRIVARKFSMRVVIVTVSMVAWTMVPVGRFRRLRVPIRAVSVRHVHGHVEQAQRDQRESKEHDERVLRGF